MKEEVTDLVKYIPVVLELRKLLGKKYSVSDSECRWITICRNSFFDGSLVAKVYPIDEDGYGDIEVHDSKLYDFFKGYAKLKGYPTIKRNFKTDDDESFYVEPEYIEVGSMIKDSEKILKLRLAKGEISSEEFSERMSRL